MKVQLFSEDLELPAGTYLARLLLGSAARNALFQAPWSVLITRERVAR
jgi:hypothetical protein